MSHTYRTVLNVSLVALLAGIPLFAQHKGGSGGGGAHGAARSYAPGGYGRGGGGYGGYGGYGFGGFTSPSYPLEGRSNYSENPCQAGCNPNAGYEWDSVGTLILDTNPPEARVTLDGIYAGTTEKLGPFQLPVGEHTLHIEAAGFEPSDVVIKFDQPGVQSLNVHLKSLPVPPKPGPHT
jgi:hypothetical protein